MIKKIAYLWIYDKKIFLAVGKIKIHKNAELEKQRIRHGSEVEGTNQTKSFHPIFRDSQLWILLLSISIILSAKCIGSSRQQRNTTRLIL